MKAYACEMTLHLAVMTQLPHVDIVNEGDVVLRMPVQAVAMHREGNGVQHTVYGRNNLLSILTWTQSLFTGTCLQIVCKLESS